jgi:ABC-type transporter Mla MlaB component
MEIVVSRENGRVPVTVFHVKGEITVESYEELQRQAQDAYAGGMRNLLLDLTEVTFVSSSGLRAIHNIFDLLRGDGTEDSDETVRNGVREGTFRSSHLKILNPTRDVLRVLRMSGFDMFLDIHADLQEAIASF